MLASMEKALEDLIKWCNKEITKLNRDYNAMVSVNNIAIGLVTIKYKDYEIHDVNDIQDLYGNGYITEHRYELLVQELQKERALVSLESRYEVLEFKIKYLTTFKSNLEYTLKVERSKI